MATDARSKTKEYLDTYLEETNITKDDGASLASFITAYGKPNYPMTKVFMVAEKAVDLVFSIGEPESKANLDTDQTPWAYEESVPIEIYCVDKPDITGTKLKWTAEAELRRIVETYPLGSQRSLERRGDLDQRLGSTTLYGTRFVLNYVRAPTT